MEHRKAIIKIVSLQSDGDNSSKIELVSEGYLTALADGFEVAYNETQATGFEGSSTRLTYKNGGYITMNRSGSWSSKLILEEGKRHLCRYGTPYGDLSVGVYTSMVSAHINDDGAKMEFHYTIDIGSETVGKYEIVLQAKPEDDDMERSVLNQKGNEQTNG